MNLDVPVSLGRFFEEYFGFRNRFYIYSSPEVYPYLSLYILLIAIFNYD